MAYLDKEAYDRKADYAGRRMAENAKIETLTEEQHDVLSWLCSLRHEMHSNQEDFFFNESGNYGKFTDAVNDDRDVQSINGQLNMAKLPKIKWTKDIYDYDTESEVYELEDHSEYADDEWDELIDSKRREALRFAESVNADIEEYLRKIDEEHGTEYAPSGATRIF